MIGETGVGRVILNDGTMLDMIVHLKEVQIPESRYLEVDGRRSFQSAILMQSSSPVYCFEGELLHVYKPVE